MDVILFDYASELAWLLTGSEKSGLCWFLVIDVIMSAGCGVWLVLQRAQEGQQARIRGGVSQELLDLCASNEGGQVKTRTQQ